MTNALLPSYNSAFVDVQIITLRQHLKELAYTEAWQHTTAVEKCSHCGMSLLQEQADVLMSTKYHSAKEFVSIGDDAIVVGVNADKVDDTTIDHALVLLSRIEKFEPGVRTEMGELIHVYDT